MDFAALTVTITAKITNENDATVMFGEREGWRRREKKMGRSSFLYLWLAVEIKNQMFWKFDLLFMVHWFLSADRKRKTFFFFFLSFLYYLLWFFSFCCATKQIFDIRDRLIHWTHWRFQYLIEYFFLELLLFFCWAIVFFLFIFWPMWTDSEEHWERPSFSFFPPICQNRKGIVVEVDTLRRPIALNECEWCVSKRIAK